ncbi:Lon protease family protein [Methylobacillus flagellatus]|uniref:endopeptidase La n=1 Tax=Methylobacillus flagellatus (strain ATCC 51484 / DSM 6875 / VKM B-1610 / KT) TaxID=265072 RepID=Q1H1V5_METFK|nr:AAA family ATPase [Methylobacillus flagellatus]ABE49532.1 ATP-dependent protease-like protein [Methylobacillus flagellatus KT]
MLSKLTPQQLNISIDPQSLGFDTTAELLLHGQHDVAQWIGQERAFAAASLGLRMQHPGYHMLVIGEPGSGRISLVRKMMEQALAEKPAPADLVYLLNVQLPEKPILLRLKAGRGSELRHLLEQFVRKHLRIIPALLQRRPSTETGSGAGGEASLKASLEQELGRIRQQILPGLLEPEVFERWSAGLVQEVLDHIELFSTTANHQEADDMQDAFLGRFRANLLLSNDGLSGSPVIYDADPSHASLFGGVEAMADHHFADFMRLKAGNLLRANGGVLILHLEDILGDRQDGSSPLLEKLGRVLRNRKLQIEDAGSASGNAALNTLMPEALPLDFKLILVASRDDYYYLHEQHADFLQYFRIKVEFADSVKATPDIYRQIAGYIAHHADGNGLPHFSAPAVARLLQVLHEWEEDKCRVSLALGRLLPLLQEAAALTQPGNPTGVAEVEQALAATRQRHDYAEEQIRDSILDGELKIAVTGRQVGRINGLTHIDMGDAAFGSPVQISARCHPGRQGIINIDREVKLTGPQHDKGMFILQHWLAAMFVQQAPLSLNASLVFEQEYHGVEGDSASCAELYALLSSLSGLPLAQGIAVTGAMNQHGDVLPIGGINEKIEGHFRLCEKLGLNGQQGVLLPASNLRHVLLHRDIILAMAEGKFHLYTMEHVLDGIALLTGLPAGSADKEGAYPADTVLGHVQRSLRAYQDIYRRNHYHTG